MRSVLLLACLCLLGLSGCLTPLPQAPIPMLEYQTRAEGRQPNLLVLLRGIGAGNEVFEKEGIIDEIRQRQLPFDVVAPDAHFGYYRARTLEERLHDDIIAPARQSGYRQVWLAGFSMGGLGSLFYLKYFPNDVDGVLLSSPFLGWGEVASEVRSAGGVQAWQGVTSSEDDWERLLWSWIKEYGERRSDYPPIFLGYGEDDFLTGSGPALLAGVLPPERVFSIPGNHDIATFKRIFLRHLDRLGEIIGAKLDSVVPEGAAADAR